jgi:hypothetical protein
VSPTISPASSSSPSPTSASPTSSPSPAQWPVYTDSDYHFSISYPAGFVVERHPSDGRTGLLVSYRAVDPIYQNGYPPGDLDFAVYAKDANSLSDWVTKHSGSSGSTDITRYWTPVANETPTTIGNSAALSFDWVPDMGDRTLHATILFFGSAYVLLVQWWSNDATYVDTLNKDYVQMLNSIQV